MRAVDCLAEMRRAGEHYQRPVNQFVDDFRRAPEQVRAELVADAILQSGPFEGLVAAVVSALCREVGMSAPRWVETVHSPLPFFAFPASSYAMRVRLMIEAPPPFRVRNVFVPETYLSRA